VTPDEKVQFSKQHYKTLSDREVAIKRIAGEAYLHKAVMISGTLRCGLCNGVIRPLHSKSSCCKASYKRYMQENEATYIQNKEPKKG